MRNVTTAKTEVKNQHFVPRSYLRHFTNDGKHLWVYDKVTGKSFGTTVDKVAQKNRFYDVPIGSPGADPNWDKQTVERWLGKTEAGFAKDLDTLLSEVERGGSLSVGLKERLAQFIAIQSIRTPKFREHLVWQYNMLRQQIYDEGRKRGLEDEQIERLCEERGVGVEVGKQAGSVRHAHMLLGTQIGEMYCDSLVDCAWIVGRNAGMVPLYTSDAPVIQCVRGHFAIFLPLLTERILLMYHPRSLPPYMYPLGVLDGTFVDLDEDHVRHFNAMQLAESQRHIFCATDTFNTARNAIEEWNPNSEVLDIPGWPLPEQYHEFARQFEKAGRELRERYG